MRDLLLKLNMIKNHNYIVKLKKENSNNIGKIKDCKTLFEQYKASKQAEVDEINNKIKQLEENNKQLKDKNSVLENETKKLQDENLELENNLDFYKKIIERIPKFIVKLFVPKRLLLNKGE